MASAWENDAPVLATPILLWFGELACMKVIEGCLGDGMMSVGVGHNSKHLAATPEAFTIEVTATLVNAEGKMLFFSVEARDGVDLIFEGEHSRAVIDAARFRQRIFEKASTCGVREN